MAFDESRFNAILDKFTAMLDRMATAQAAPPAPVNVSINLGELLDKKKVQPSDGDAPPDSIPDPGRRAPYPYTS